MALITTVGIDVGGERKGFHAVALTGGTTTDQLVTADVEALRDWCLNTHNALVIAIDAPCRWSHDGRMRACERELMRQGMHCFASPSRERAVQHPSNYYGWMLRGEALYQALETSHPLCTAHPIPGERCCLETFPHAITWHLRGGNAQARQKHTQRRDLLQQAGINLTPLTSIDLVDAALCALTAHLAASGAPCTIYGEETEGVIVVPAAVPALSPHRSPKPIANVASAAQALEGAPGMPTASGSLASRRARWAEAAAAGPAKGLMDPPSNSRFDHEEWQW
jgi:predicted nuclease with RNAse H fold